MWHRKSKTTKSKPVRKIIFIITTVNNSFYFLVLESTYYLHQKCTTADYIFLSLALFSSVLFSVSLIIQFVFLHILRSMFPFIFCMCPHLLICLSSIYLHTCFISISYLCIICIISLIMCLLYDHLMEKV